MEANWQTIETMPEKTAALLYCPLDDVEPYKIGSFQWVQSVVSEVESETTNRLGTRRIIQERTEREREWSNGVWGAEFWTRLPEPPSA